MTPLVRKILESGLVDKNVALMFKKWGQLDPEALELLETRGPSLKASIVESFEQLAETIEDIIDVETESFRETRLDLYLQSPALFYFGNQTIIAARDEWFRLFTSPKHKVYRGAILTNVEDGTKYTILDIDKVYSGDKIIALQLTVEQEVQNAQMPESGMR